MAVAFLRPARASFQFFGRGYGRRRQLAFVSASGLGVGLYTADSFAEWRALHAPAEVAAEAGLPSPSAASGLEAVRLPALLDAAEIDELLSFGREVRELGIATSYRTGEGELFTVHGCSSLKPDAEQVRWQTTYLHAGHLFRQRLPKLYAKLRTAALAADAEQWGGLCARAAAAAEGVAESAAGDSRGSSAAGGGSVGLGSSGGSGGSAGLGSSGGSSGGSSSTSLMDRWIHVRTMELHEVMPGGALPQRNHYDSGSCVTLDVMLARPGLDFTGGAVEFPNPGIDDATAPRPVQSLPFEQGDALVFPSHKFHCVNPVASGERRVLVVEFWCGDERSCPHRCNHHYGECHFGGRGDAARSLVRQVLQASMEEQRVGPW